VAARVQGSRGGRFPQIETQHMYVDALCMQMVRDPRGFDVIVTNNMLAISSPISPRLQGGLGMAASANLHREDFDVRARARFRAAIAGKNIANPFGAILTRL